MSNRSDANVTIPRRTFLHAFALLGGSVIGGKSPLALLRAAGGQMTDARLCLERLRLGVGQSLKRKQISDVMVAIGKSFLGTPYVANTLEASGEEHLVVNLHEMDCVTFVENTLALSRCIGMEQETVESFRRELQLIRYRGGTIEGYPSRLHYFSDWIFDNAQKKIVRDLSAEIGGLPDTRTINFMSTHRSSYRQLSDGNLVKEMESIEAKLNKRDRFYVPKDRLKEVQDEIHSGDILAVTTSVQGLDVSHTGLAIRLNDELYFLHAPISGEAVQISSKPLVDYLNAGAKHTGLMIARPRDPKKE